MRLKTLNGAPLLQNLDFSDQALLKSGELEPAFRAFLMGATAPLSKTVNHEEASNSVKWRRVDPRNNRLRTGWSQPYLPRGERHQGELSFPYSIPPPEVAHSFTSDGLHDTTLTATEHTEDDHYFEHSLILHDTLLSSQIIFNDSEHSFNTCADDTINTASFLSTYSEITTSDANDSSEQNGCATVLQLPANLSVTSLEAIPSASHLTSILPQTLTPTFMCVLTAKEEPRQVSVRKGAYIMFLHEITVADETKSGFKISLWFRPPGSNGRAPNEAQERLRETLERAQVGEILLLRNIALSMFRNNVFGQSLNPGINKAKTTMDIVQSNDGLSKVKRVFPVTVEEKFRRLQQWIALHVVPKISRTQKRKDFGGDARPSKRTGRLNSKEDDTLPPDTLEAL